ncbi:beta-mannosidase [Marinomonas sp.]|uniref:beta-mannosidase n=1 Tax=Marinomonas sp. TaxID=1904862 RepID=UPI003BAB68A7
MNNDLLLLNDGWTVCAEDKTDAVPLNVPGDLHSALLDAGKIDDPYWRDNETTLDWIHQTVWIAKKTFQINNLADAFYTLRFTSVDCLAEVTINGKPAGVCESQFLRYDFDVTEHLIAGKNTIEVRFLSNTLEAKNRAENSTIPIPYMALNSRIGHLNFLRKAQCHGGWNWNIALSPLGFYGDISLLRTNDVRLDDVSIRQRHEDNAVELDVTFFIDAVAPCAADLSVTIDDQQVSDVLHTVKGRNQISLTARINNPELWWPAGQGSQKRYELIIKIGKETRQYEIGLRNIELLTNADEIGHRFAFKVNDREIFMKGANWIPGDALPARATPEQVRDLLQSAVDANMNMLRIWGGGQYEAEWFYELCDELGIMVWQDFMFACNLYPAHQRQWLDLVRQEARQQLRRLSRFACVALWCGDNELVGALKWYQESSNDRDRYLAIYDRLNHALEEAVEDENTGIPFWPSSPSIGRLNFGDGWHIDTSGDMHFWDVWHSSKDFEHYRTVRPRFCSEFGFQSFPSMRVIESFTEEQDRNVSSSVMDVHQRNDGGNSRIVETIARYFRFPDGFEDLLYLSQLGQGLAMKTAIEFWRSNKPRTMGTLFWQLNDTWPVASWASLEYGGGWKTTQYLAKRFYANVLVTAQPDSETGDILLHAISDLAQGEAVRVRVRSINIDTNKQTEIGQYDVITSPTNVVEVTRIAPESIAENDILLFDWQDGNGMNNGENEYLPKRPKAYRLQEPTIHIEVTENDSQTKQITLTSDRLALFVTYDHGGDDIYSDNCFTLVPNEPKVLTVIRKRHSHLKQNGTPKIEFLKG